MVLATTSGGASGLPTVHDASGKELPVFDHGRDGSWKTSWRKTQLLPGKIMLVSAILFGIDAFAAQPGKLGPA